MLVKHRLEDRPTGVGHEGAAQGIRHPSIDFPGQATCVLDLAGEPAAEDFGAGAEQHPPMPTVLLALDDVEREQVTDQGTVLIYPTPTLWAVVERAATTLAVDPGGGALAIHLQVQIAGRLLLIGRQIDDAPLAPFAFGAEGE